jgi:hypothetical protein
VDLVTRVGRDSDEVTLPATREVFTLGLLAGMTPRAGSTSSTSSESESTATRFAWGVFRGCPGGVMTLAVPFATCLLGVTGGSGIDVGVVCMASTSSSVSAGGVAGVTRAVGDFAAAAAWAFRISSTAAHLDHSSCLRYIYCCCGPTTLPGRTIRMKAIASLAVKPYFQIRYAPTRVPVRPNPALHCRVQGQGPS